LKNPNTENLHRGLFRFTGLPLVTLAITAAATATNLRQLCNWHDRTGNGDPTNPLLAPEPRFHGFALLEGPADDENARREPDRRLNPAHQDPAPHAGRADGRTTSARHAPRIAGSTTRTRRGRIRFTVATRP
jgi:hypothetical protein